MPNFVKTADMIEAAVNAGATKSKLPLLDMIIRGLYSGFCLGISTSVAAQATTQFGPSFTGAMVFPGGFMLIVFYGWELVTGNMSLIPMAFMARKTTFWRLALNLVVVWCCNFLGTALYVAFFYGAMTSFGVVPDAGALGKTIISTAKGKTIPYYDAGAAGWFCCFFKAILCNFLVTFAALGSLVSTSLVGKVVACWIPVVMFASLGYEHVVVNMFVIPSSMTLGSGITWSQWWLWNIIPATLGNFFGACMMVAVPMWVSWGHEFRRKQKAEKAEDKDFALLNEELEAKRNALIESMPAPTPDIAHNAPLMPMVDPMPEHSDGTSGDREANWV